MGRGRNTKMGRVMLFEKDGILYATQTRKIGCLRKEFIKKWEIPIDELSDDQRIYFRKQEGYTYEASKT